MTRAVALFNMVKRPNEGATMTKGNLWTREELEAYLSDMYVSLDVLSADSGLSTDTLEKLIEAGCIPGPSYELRQREEIYAFINDDVNTLSVRTTARYFARDTVAWLIAIKPRLESLPITDLSSILKAEMREAFEAGLRMHGAQEIEYEGFVSASGGIDETGFDRHFEDYIWPHWCNGTWGICVYGADSMQNIARKTVAVRRLRKLTDNGTKSTYSVEEASLVRAAIAEYDAIVPPFSPHDRHESSRAKLVETTLRILEGS